MNAPRNVRSFFVLFSASVSLMFFSQTATATVATYNVYDWVPTSGSNSWNNSAIWTGTTYTTGSSAGTFPISGTTTTVTNPNYFTSTTSISNPMPGQTQSGTISLDMLVIDGTSTVSPVTGTIGIGTGTIGDLNVDVTSGTIVLNINGSLSTMDPPAVTYYSGTGLVSGTTNVFLPTTTFATDDEYISSGSGHLVINVSGTYLENIDGGTYGLGISGANTNFNILNGATVVANSLTNNDPIAVSSSTLNVSGTLAVNAALTTPYSTVTNTVVKDAGTINFLSGGNALFYGINQGGNTGNGPGSLLTIGSGANVTLLYNSTFTSGGLFFGANNAGGYANIITMTGGTMTNQGQLTIGGVNTKLTAGGTTTMTVSGTGGVGTWVQNGVTSIGNGNVGTLTVSSGGNFTAASNVYVGGGASTTDTIPTWSSSVSTSGTLTINGGLMVVTNTNAGVLYNTTLGSYQGSNGYYFAQTGSTTFSGVNMGQAFEFATLGTPTGTLGVSGGTLSTGTVYYGGGDNGLTSSENGMNSFAVNLTAGGTNITNGGGTYKYATASYYTLGSQVVIGSVMTFASGSTYAVPGTLNMTSGTLQADQILANMGSGTSTINFAGGMMIADSVNINTGSTMVVGNGTQSATLAIWGAPSGAGLQSGAFVNTSTISNGLTMNSNAGLSLGSSGTYAGSYAYQEPGLTLNGGNLAFADSTSALSIYLTGSSATPLISLVGSGTTLLNNAALTLTLASTFSATANELYFLIAGSGTVLGTFDGLAQGSTLTVGSQEFEISYDANSTDQTFSGGDDVALMALTVPEPGTVAMIAAAGCVGLFLARRRKFGCFGRAGASFRGLCTVSRPASLCLLTSCKRW